MLVSYLARRGRITAVAQAVLAVKVARVNRVSYYGPVAPGINRYTLFEYIQYGAGIGRRPLQRDITGYSPGSVSMIR